MLVPSQRLLLSAAVMMPVGLLPALLGSLGWALFSLSLVLLFVLALMDYVISLDEGADLEISTAEEARFRRDESKGLQITFKQGAGKRARQVEVGLSLPRTLQATEEIRRVKLPKDADECVVPFVLTPRRRGLFMIEFAHVSLPSRFGFWQVRRELACQLAIRVLANLSLVKVGFSNLFLTRGDHGSHAQRQLGKGREFEQLRDYVPGDGYEDVHWKATAKRGEPVTKLFRIERTQEIYGILDASRLSQQELPNVIEDAEALPDTIYERYVTAATVLSLASERQGDHFGMASFSNHLEIFIRAKSGRAHQQHCQEALAKQHPRAVTPDFQDVFSALRLRLRQRAFLIFLTDLSDPVAAEAFCEHIPLLARQHHVIVVMIVPDVIEPLFQGANVESERDVFARLSGHLQWQTLRQTQLKLQRHGVMLVTATEENLAATVVNRYIDAKQRQLV